MIKPKVILATMFLSGSSQLLAAPAPVSEVGASSSMSSTALETRLQTLERMVANRNVQFLQLQQQLESLQDEVSQLRGVTEEQGYQLEKVLQRQRELYQEIETRVSSYSAPTQVADTTSDVSSGTMSNNLSENDAYDRAVQLIMQDKRYDDAIPEFKAFLTNYPDSVYVPNAHYWLGQLLTIKNDSKGALTHFESLVNGFPDSNKRSDAMLKLANTYLKEGETVRAKKILNDLVAQYPDSTPAKLAVEKLASLN
ncbi:Outer membrane protein assembly factor BamD [Pseudoalteromonas sp. P1-9]|nr:tol-pal system protein YbgF [Pseudoalteromonas sp. MMG024]KPV97732.1 Outer membrane protein assembly factor BamD [Pseudoalteromonas sp. P1-9]